MEISGRCDPEVNEKLVPELQENARQQVLDLQLAQVEG